MREAALPPLDAPAALRSEAIVERIRVRAQVQGGWLPFREFMQIALYEPGLGYYMAEHAIFGPEGDYVTAPELSPLFARCLAHSVADALRHCGGDDVVEFGAGSGRLAVELVGALGRLDVSPRRYRIVEPSPALAARQQRALEREFPAAGFAGRFEWLARPPGETWQGVAIANEVIDALPVDRFRIAEPGPEALGVAVTAQHFHWQARPADHALAAAIAALQVRLPSPMSAGFVSELRPGLDDWFAQASAALTRGAIFVCDYGLPSAQYYHPSRDGGTLAAFRRHRRVENVLADPGAQDLTAWVDFTALAEAARERGFVTAGYATQAHFLLATGIERELARLLEGATERERVLHRQAAATLLLPGEMGERFKILALARGLDGPMSGFDFRDLSTSL